MAVFRVTDYGATGNGSTNDTRAFQAVSIAVNQAGGGTIVIPPGVYVVGLQDAAAGLGHGYAYRGQPILRIANCGAVEIRGEADSNGVLPKLVAAGGLKYGSFTPGGNAYAPSSMPFYNWDYRADAYPAMIHLVGNQNVTVHNLELDGNIAGLNWGGTWGDVGWQVHATGIWAMENRNVVIRNVHSHDHGLDGVQIGYHGLTDLDADAPHLLEDVRSEYNGRQGLSWVGGIGLTAVRCKFNFTGRRLVNNWSPPASGVDAEAEGSVCRKGLFVDCEFLDNKGQGLVADTGDVEDVRLVRCRFAGTTNYSVWPNKPRIVFEECDFSGSVVHTYGSHDSARATKFLRCHFEDRPYATGKPVYGVALIEAHGNNVLYEGCTIIANASRALWIDEPGTREIIRDTVVVHRATSAGGTALQPGEFQSLVRGSVLEGVEFREEIPAGTTGPFYIGNAGAEIRRPIWVQGPKVRWGTTSGPVGVIGGAVAVPYRLQRVLYYGDAPPAGATAGEFARGDVIINRAAVAGGTAGWICVAGGNPGTWKAFGPIST